MHAIVLVLHLQLINVVATSIARTPRSACLSVCVLVTRVRRAKTAAPIEMPFGRGTRMRLRNLAA